MQTRLILLLALVLSLSACGQKGPLYHPEAAPQGAAKTAPQE
jgi:predicted small lipoprotein YifL